MNEPPPPPLPLADRIALVIAVVFVGGAFIASRIPQERLAATPLCWSVAFFDRECAGCGLTRSVAAIGRGAFHAAVAFNPLGPVLFGAALSVIVVRGGKIAQPRSRLWRRLDIVTGAAVALALIARLVSYYLV